MMERFSVAITSQLQVDVSAKRVWDRLHKFDDLQSVFSTVHNSEFVLGSNNNNNNNKSSKRSSGLLVGNKVKVSRLLPTGHCFLATYSIVRHDPERMEIQFYSEDIVKPGTATVSTTWAVEALGNENSCMVTCSFAIVPHKMMIAAGRCVFAPFLKKIVKRTIKQDLKDLAASFEKEDKTTTTTTEEVSSSRPSSSSMLASNFDDKKETESCSERTRSTSMSMDDVSSSVSGLSYSSRLSPLGRFGYPEEEEEHEDEEEELSIMRNIREVQPDGSIRTTTFTC